MKLTVCFGDAKVVVPCGLGNVTIRDLTLSGLRRVRHTLPRLGPQDRIVVHSINVARDGGMLDWDDLVCDVLDDREMVTAQFSIATLANNAKDSCPNRPTGLDSIFQSLSTPLVVDLCSDSATGPSCDGLMQSNATSEFADSGLNAASACGVGFRQNDTNGHIVNKLLHIGDESTNSSNLSLNLSNDSCGMHQPDEVHPSQFCSSIHQCFLNKESSCDSGTTLRSNINTVIFPCDNKEWLTTSSQSPPTCCNTVSSTCELPTSPVVSGREFCPNSIITNTATNSKHCHRTKLSPNVFEMLSNTLSCHRDLIESGWDSDDEDEDLCDPDGGYSYDYQVGEQQSELTSLPNGGAILHPDTVNNRSKITLNTSSGESHYCSEGITESNSHKNTGDNFCTVGCLPVSFTSNSRPVLSNPDIWPLPQSPFPPSDVAHFDISTNSSCRVHSPEDEYHIGINTERLIRAVRSRNSFSSLNGFDRCCTTSEQLNSTYNCDLEPNSLIHSPENLNPLSYSQPNLVTYCDDIVQKQNVRHLSNTHIAENIVGSNSLNHLRQDQGQFQSSHICNVNSSKSLVISNRPAGASCSRVTARLGTIFQSSLTVPTIVEEEEEYSVDSERLPNLTTNKTEHQLIGNLMKTRINPLPNNDHIDINEAVEEDYPLLRKDYVLEKDQASVSKSDVLHVNTSNNNECNANSHELYLSTLHLHSNDNLLPTTHRSIRGLPKPDVIRWLENTRDATMNHTCKTEIKSNLSNISSSASTNLSDFNANDQQPEKASLNVIESPSISKSQESINSKDSVVLIRLVNTKRGENLGIQIKPIFSDVLSSNDNCSDENGSRIIIPNGRVAREQCLSVGDRILSINGISLSGIPFEKGRDLFQEALNEPEMLLRVLPRSAYHQYSSPVSMQNEAIKMTTEKSEKPSCGVIVIVSEPSSKAKEAEAKSDVNQLKPVPPPPPRRSPNTVLTRITEGIVKPLIDECLQVKKQQELNSSQPPSYTSEMLAKSVLVPQVDSNDNLNQYTCHTIQLCKGSNGLGFSLTSRDSLSSDRKLICVDDINQKQHERVIVEQPSSHGINLTSELSKCNYCSSGISQEFNPLPPSHPSYKLYEIDPSNWSLYLFDIHLPLIDKSNNSERTNAIQHTDCTAQQLQSTVKRQTSGNPATLGVSVSVRCLSNNSYINESERVSSTTTDNHSNAQIDKTNDSQWNAVFVRTVIDGGPAYQDGRLQVGDRLLTIDGQTLSGLSTSDALNRLKSIIAHDLNESHPCVHLLIARPQKGTNLDNNSYANSLENTNEIPINKITNFNQHETSIKVSKKESYSDNNDHSKSLLVSAVVHSSESVLIGMNSQDPHDLSAKYSLSSNKHCPSTDLSSTSSLSSSQQLPRYFNSSATSNTRLCTNQNSQPIKKIPKTLHSNSPNSTGNINNSHETKHNSEANQTPFYFHLITVNASLLCNTEKLCQTSKNNNIDVNKNTADVNDCNNVTTPEVSTTKSSNSDSVQSGPHHIDIDYCGLENVQALSTTSSLTRKPWGSICSLNSDCTLRHHHRHRRRRSHFHHNHNENVCLNSMCCYSGLDHDAKKRISSYSSSSTEMLYNYRHHHHLSKQHSNYHINEHDNSSSCHQCITLDDSELNYEATLSDPETERYYYKLDSISDSNLSSVSSNKQSNVNLEKTITTSHECYATHCRYFNKCKYRVVYRQPKIDFSQMVLVPFDPTSWTGPVLKPRTALNPEELQLIDDMRKPINSLSSQENSNNEIDFNHTYDKHINGRNMEKRSENNSIASVDAKCINNGTSVRLRKTSHPKTVISKLFSLVKTTAHRRTADQNTLSDLEHTTTECQLSADNSSYVPALVPGENVSTAVGKRTTKFSLNASHNSHSTISTIQENSNLENSTSQLLKSQSTLPIDLQSITGKKLLTNSIEKSTLSPSQVSHPSCYTTLHERLEPPIHIYDTAHNIQMNNSNDNKSDPSILINEQPTMLDAKYSPSPQTDVIQTTKEIVFINQPEDANLTQLQATKYADLSFSPNSSLNNRLSRIPLLLTNATINNNNNNIAQVTAFNRTVKELTGSQHRPITSDYQHHFTSLSKNAVNRLEIYEDAEALYRHLSDLKQSTNSDVQTIDSSDHH
ncbi:Partitioning defective 3 like [Schistosoma japonicum]|nr:Partitioning defective 3 like [Schistosoma japonicum]